MTICIAALCDDSRQVIVASDRMVTAEYPPVEFEHGIHKFEILSNTCVALTAGSALAHTDLFREVRERLKNLTSPEIRSIAEEAEKCFVSRRKAVFEKQYLLPRGLTLRKFYEEQHDIHPDIVMRLDSLLETQELELDILLAGVDHSGAHIYSVMDPGRAECFDALGYSAIGTGDMHAMSTLIYNDYTPKVDLRRALYLVYESKKAAERAPGVGSATDMAIVSSQGIVILGEDKIEMLDEIYARRAEISRNSLREIEAQIAGLDFGGKRL